MNDFEIRFNDAQFETREDAEQGNKLVGYASMFNTDYPVGGFSERIAPGAFTNALKRKDDTRALFNHDPNQILGRSTAGTLQLWEDSKGLGFEVLLPETQTANDIRQLIKRGDINQCSFAFTVDDEEWKEVRKGEYLRIVKDVHLYDVSVVAYPASEATRVSVRAQDKYKELNTECRDGAELQDDKDIPDEVQDSFEMDLLEKELNLKEKELLK